MSQGTVGKHFLRHTGGQGIAQKGTAKGTLGSKPTVIVLRRRGLPATGLGPGALDPEVKLFTALQPSIFHS